MNSLYRLNVILVFLLLFLAGAFAQSVKSAAQQDFQIVRLTPEEEKVVQEMSMRMLQLREEGQEHWRIKEFNPAIRSLKAAVELELAIRRVGGVLRSSSLCTYELGRCLTEAGRPKEALEVYRQMRFWNPLLDDWEISGPHPVVASLDYALLASEQGDIETAKEMYYYAMRIFNPLGASHFEPFLFLIVFDPDPNMEVWTYTKDNFRRAAHMLKILADYPDHLDLLSKLRRDYPNWIYPIVYELKLSLRKWESDSDVEREKQRRLTALALSLARTADEREMILSISDRTRDRNELGLKLRTKSELIQRRRRP